MYKVQEQRATNRKEVEKMKMLHYSILDAIPITIFVVVTCSVSYWHGKSEHGLGIPGLIYTIVLGTLGQILVGFFPMISP